MPVFRRKNISQVNDSSRPSVYQKTIWESLAANGENRSQKSTYGHVRPIKASNKPARTSSMCCFAALI